MMANAGNLDGLVGFSFGASQFVGVTVASFGQAADGSVIDVLTEVIGAPSALAQADGSVSYTIAGVNDGTGQVAVNQYGSVNNAASFVQTLSYNVLGYNVQSMLVSTLSLPALVAALQGGQDVAGQLGVIATTAIPAGGTLAFSPSGVFTGALACFALGTRILTDAGEVPVEEIWPGDRVPGQLSGRSRRVCWVGRRTVEVADHPRPWDVAPVRIRAHAFAPNRPARDLRLSPDHAVLVGGVLIPVRYLVNGATVVQQLVPRITYLHIELEAHDVLLAEAMPCESFLDTGNRGAFAPPPPPPPLLAAAALGARPHG
jgi:Hint domain